MQNLTNSTHWDCYWKYLKLPVTVDLQKDYGRTMDQLFKIHLSRGHKSFLEVGCGSSKWLVYFYKTFGYAVFGIDSSEQACETSKRNLEIMKVPGKIYCQDVFSLTGGRTFDVIFSGGVIEHFSNPCLILRQMVQLLSPGGQLITTIPNLSSIYWFIQKLVDPKLYRQHFKIELNQLSNMYKEVGLTVNVIRYVGSFDLFSIEWSRLRTTSEFWRTFGIPLLGKVNGATNRVLRKYSVNFESKNFSPFIAAIGVKK